MDIEHLLIVEDDDLLARQTARALERHGITVQVAHNHHEASQHLNRSERLDAAVLDQNLGQDNGLDLIAPILARFPDCRVLLLTGYGSIAAAVAATHRGAHNYLTKPANVTEILAALHMDPASQPPTLPETPPSLQRLEWEHIQRTLDAHDGNISRAAQALGIHRRTLQRRLKKRPSASNYDRER
ncbi:DNA-binding response regulator [Alcanivorax hongdengensis A-11-3]|uniref:DNA-binding response regulator n=1 Tax=Alcanivorax hongdengensis A-11-3 TaxID=1177179 RepID=L0WAJ6_9GAMM|nr:response regulator [Alcanivorax hongdengensis]EKF73976.1 DNA-binding response regulator [Alcanivorax hongdengensis A-11-3]